MYAGPSAAAIRLMPSRINKAFVRQCLAPYRCAAIGAAHHGDPIEDFAGNIAGAAEPSRGCLIDQIGDPVVLEMLVDTFDPARVWNSDKQTGRDLSTVDVERNRPAANGDHSHWLLPPLDRRPYRLAKLEAATCRWHRRHVPVGEMVVPTDEDRNDRNVHFWRQKVKWDEDRVIGFECLHQRKVESGCHRL